MVDASWDRTLMVGLFAASFFGLVPSFLPPTPCVRGTPCAACHSQRSPNQDSRAWWRRRTGSAAWAARRGSAFFFPSLSVFFCFSFPTPALTARRITSGSRLPRPSVGPWRCRVVACSACTWDTTVANSAKCHHNRGILVKPKKRGGQEINRVVLSPRLRPSHLLSRA